ncbi:hypothetical protein CK203_058066 [Vitis vinifera]|uniref:Retrotransposon gag domain-containing protein n=1 Tax=Vitis vinifera TaxID=29760 RepID=A0A438GEX2_VITVI|nr:hypothetical protein CK203_058066 [Vitis vinifera]
MHYYAKYFPPAYKDRPSHGFIATSQLCWQFQGPVEAFVGQYLCSARHKQNINTLQNIKMQDNESLREFVKRFGQAVLQVEAAVWMLSYKIFKRSICPGTPFFESLAKKPPTTMDDLFRRANNIQCSKMTCVQPPNKFWLPDDHLEVTRREMLNLRTGQGRPIGGRRDRVARIGRPPRLFPYHKKLLPMIQGCLTSGGQDPKEQTHPQGIIARDVPSTRNTVTRQKHAGASSIWSRSSSRQDI